ncbi:hypothetical protein [Belnapia sp. F-4-1]|uniref:hypothetical protein n=1 Tax=Belnapia sp. F-4-1 TaxID=1545443 RepID=UPI0011865066|nr:hypothetical protein [Belnapia sp. F-4-1]
MGRRGFVPGWRRLVGRAVQLKIEAGGPPVMRPPDRRGSGTRLPERALAHDLGSGGAVELRFEPAGVLAAVRFVPVP